SWIDPSVILIGSSSGAVLRSTDGGATFSAPIITGLTGAVSSLLCNGSTCLAGGPTNNKIAQSSDGGLTWTLRRDVIGPAFDNAGVVGFASFPGIYYALGAGQPVFSTDNGVTWNDVILDYV